MSSVSLGGSGQKSTSGGSVTYQSGLTDIQKKVAKEEYSLLRDYIMGKMQTAPDYAQAEAQVTQSYNAALENLRKTVDPADYERQAQVLKDNYLTQLSNLRVTSQTAQRESGNYLDLMQKLGAFALTKTKIPKSESDYQRSVGF